MKNMEIENGRSIAVLVADDHAILRRGLIDIINHEADMRVVAEANDGPESVRRYDEYRPDVALIDLAMPGLGGIEVIRMIKASHPDAKLIILTTYDTDEDIELGFKAGAQAYLLKDVTSEDLVECIRDVMGGRKRVAPAIAEKLADRISRVQLTGRELRVLRLITEGKANKEIADTLGISDATVKAHITNVLSKLQVSSRTEALAVAIKRGLVRVI
jgi:two-component system NarL family response regulator